MTPSVVDVMTRELFTVDPHMPLADLEWELSKRRISGAPVVEDGKLVGMISRADIVRRIGFSHAMSDMALDYYRQLEGTLEGGRQPEMDRLADQNLGSQLRTLRVRDAMTSRPATLPATATAQQAAQLMLDRRVHRVVITQNTQPIGLVSTLDLVRLLASMEPSELQSA